mgnify:CR=1 FL=1
MNYTEISETKLEEVVIVRYYLLPVKENEICLRKYHRLDGPSVVNFDINGNITAMFFSVMGKWINEEKYWAHPLVAEYKLNHILEL